MAVAEIIVGLVPLPFTVFYYNFGNYKNIDEMTELWCYLNKLFMDALPPISHNIANLLTVLLAAQRLFIRRLSTFTQNNISKYEHTDIVDIICRYISIAYPMSSRRYVRVSNVKKAAVVIIVLSVANGLQKIFDTGNEVIVVDRLIVHHLNMTTMNQTIVTGEWITVKQCSRPSLAWVVNAIGVNLYYNIYYWTRTLLFTGIPCISLIVFNALLIKGIRKSQRRKERLLR